jgi:hypothetical protein
MDASGYGGLLLSEQLLWNTAQGPFSTTVHIHSETIIIGAIPLDISVFLL